MSFKFMVALVGGLLSSVLLQVVVLLCTRVVLATSALAAKMVRQRE